MKKCIFIFVILFTFNSNAQLFQDNGIGGTIGVVLNVGTHVNRIGINVNSYYYYKFFQINYGTQFHFNASNWEGRKGGTEFNPYVGVQIYYSKEDVDNQFTIHETSLNSGKKFGIGYTYKFYLSSLKSSQSSGLIGLHINDMSFIVENDIFGFNGKDRFRTSAFSINYRFHDFEISVQNILWTGETRGVATKVDPEYKAKLGLKDISSLKYGKVSHGIICAKLNYRLPYGQVLNASVGWDAEAFRHVIQNKLVHDLINNPHYPVLDENGLPQYKTNAPKRKSVLYLQVGFNNYGFY